MVKEVNQVATDTANQVIRYKHSQTSPIDCHSGAQVVRLLRSMHGNFIYLLMFPVVSKAGKSSNETCCPIQACTGKIISHVHAVYA